MSEDTCVRCNGTGKNSGGRRCGRCGGDGREVPPVEGSQDFDADEVTAQDVIDALRMALMAQKNPAEIERIVKVLVEYAPETESSRGIDLLLHLISEAVLKVAMADAALGGSQAKGSE